MPIDSPRSIVVLTGAGISAESGLGTFRDKDGIWTRYPLEDLATPEGFARNPEFVQQFYNDRRRQLRDARAHAGHEALTRLQKAHGAVTLVTQNVDNLHEQAGADDVVHMHGELAKSLCSNCGRRAMCDEDLHMDMTCPQCGSVGTLRPDVVWFGEIPYHMERIEDALSACDLFISIGTSGAVYPAAGFVQMARAVAAKTVELNLEPSENAYAFDDALYGSASTVVPDWVDRFLAKAV